MANKTTKGTTQGSAKKVSVRPAGSHINSSRGFGEVNEHVRVLKEYTEQKQLPDPFQQSYGNQIAGSGISIIQPVYSFYALMRMPEENAVLRQCIDAMITNIDGHGYRLSYVGPDGMDTSPVALKEKDSIQNLMDFPNDEYSMQELRDRLRRDFEVLGNSFLEVGRDRKGRVVMLSHLPAQTMRMTTKETEAIPVEVLLPRDGKTVTQKVNKRFRRFVQQVGERKVWFKEFGDPRSIDPKNGLISSTVTVESSATEVIHLSLYNPANPYGLPRWFHQMPSILGSRQAELTNLDFFKENAIPAMALLVSGGMLTQSSLNEMEAHFQSARGRASMNRILVLEATGDDSMMLDNGQVPVPKVELKALQGDRQHDALFQTYETNSMAKIRSAFRLPPIFIGSSSEYTYAAAKTSYEVAEGQVFAPERQKFDDMVNLRILSSLGAKFWAFRSNPARLSDADSVIKAVETFDKVGALTPNVSIGLANELFDLSIPGIKSEWGNYPFPLVMELIKSSGGDIAGSSMDVGKDLKELDKLDPDKGGESSGTVSEITATSPQSKKSYRSAIGSALGKEVLDSLLGLRSALETATQEPTSV